MVADSLYSGDLPRYVLDRLFDNFTHEFVLNVDDRNNGVYFEYHSTTYIKISADNRSIYDRF